MVDIAFEKDGELVFVEIEHKSDWKGNIVRGIELCHRLVSVFVRKTDYMEARLFLRDKVLDKVMVAHVHSFDDVLPSCRPRFDTE